MTEPVRNSEGLKILIDQIVETVKPDKIILFGSRSGDNFTEQSDYDILVIKDGVVNERTVSRELYKLLCSLRLGMAVDFIVASNAVIARNKDNPNMIYSDALGNGLVLYG